jgi:hypothetical protein
MENLHAYVIKMSAGVDIHIDASEVEKVMTGLKTGNSVKVRQGIFNPSFYVAIVEDRQRIESELRKLRDIDQHNRYLDAGEKPKKYQGMENLRDIFSVTEKYNEFQLPEPNQANE